MFVEEFTPLVYRIDNLPESGGQNVGSLCDEKLCILTCHDT